MNNTDFFFEQYADALLSYDAKKIADYYQVPLTVYSDNGIQPVAKMEEVEGFWKQGVQPYKKSGITKSVPEVISEEQLTKTITMSKVRWKNYNDTGKEVASETNVYILTHHDGAYKISGLIIMAS